MNNITMSQILTIIVGLTTIMSFIRLLKSIYDYNVAMPIKNLRATVDKSEETTRRQDEDIEDSKEERLLLMRGVLAYMNKAVIILSAQLLKNMKNMCGNH